MFTMKEKEDKIRKIENDKESLQRDMHRQTTKVDMIEKN